MKNKQLDTYFLDANTALKRAKEKNRAKTANPHIDGLQICYYDGEKLKKAPKNCLNVPLGEMVSYFSTTRNRTPYNIDFTNSVYGTDEQKKVFLEFFKRGMDHSISKRLQLQEELVKKTKNLEIDFDDKPLRVFIPACRETTVMQNISKNVARAFKKVGYDVLYHIQENDMQDCDTLSVLEAFYQFNPHITFNINHFNNEHINDDVINFVWFQDAMPSLRDDSSIYLRKRDNILHLTQGLGSLLKKKKIPSSYQSFCIDNNIYKVRKKIKREDKIVFIGSSYLPQYLRLVHEKKEEILFTLWNRFLDKGVITTKYRKKICNKYNIIDLHLGDIINYIERDLSLEYIVKLDLNYPIEIYGYGFEKNDILSSYYKGKLKYGKEVSKVYNTAKYSFVLGGYIMQQRTLESAASGCIPIVLDSRHNKKSVDEKCFDESLLMLKKLSGLKKVIEKNKKVNLDCIVNLNSYDKFVNKIIKTIKKEIYK
jgi:hypothetical protein